MPAPTLSEIRKARHAGELVPVFREILADFETPLSAYVKLGGGPGSFLLESVDGGERLGRYSFLGVEPEGTIMLGDGTARLSGVLGDGTVAFADPLQLVDTLLREHPVSPADDLPRFSGGAVGYLSYDLCRKFERIPAPEGPGLGLPMGMLGWYHTVLAFDHLKRTLKIITHVSTGDDMEDGYARATAKLDRIVAQLARPGSFPFRANGTDSTAVSASITKRMQVDSSYPQSNMTRDQFERAVARAKEYIVAGDAIQIVLSQRLALPCKASALALYRALRSINPSPYMYLLDYGDYQIVGASPEMLVRVEDSRVAVHPIAGTRRRGRNAGEDRELADELTADPKETAEHYMLVDLGRNDVGRVSKAGSVKVSQLLEAERYSHVMHLVSHVEGTLRDDLRPVDALRAGFPAGTVSGAPKVRAMEIISELEPDARGPYAGAVGYFGFDGAIDTAISIRTAVLKDGIANVQVGAGIVADSVPALEYEETMNKAAAMMRAVSAAEALDSGVANDTADR
ncbi:MAG TPA: anthranilate synthase component I [Chloroflexota bacterium]